MPNQYETAGQGHTGLFICYYRVSTQKQGESGLGLDAQRQAVRHYLNGGDWQMVEYTEVESARGGKHRPVLDEAIAHAKRAKATLLIAKMDRLSRNLHFVTRLHETGVKFVAADNPHANKLTVNLLAAIAEDERDRISSRTAAAIEQWQKRNPGKKWGNAASLTPGNESTAKAAAEFAADMRPTFEHMKAQGLSQRAMAGELNRLRIPTARGGQWQPTQVARVAARLGL